MSSNDKKSFFEGKSDDSTVINTDAQELELEIEINDVKVVNDSSSPAEQPVFENNQSQSSDNNSDDFEDVSEENDFDDNSDDNSDDDFDDDFDDTSEEEDFENDDDEQKKEKEKKEKDEKNDKDDNSKNKKENDGSEDNSKSDNNDKLDKKDEHSNNENDSSHNKDEQNTNKNKNEEHGDSKNNKNSSNKDDNLNNKNNTSKNDASKNSADGQNNVPKNSQRGKNPQDIKNNFHNKNVGQNANKVKNTAQGAKNTAQKTKKVAQKSKKAAEKAAKQAKKAAKAAKRVAKAVAKAAKAVAKAAAKVAKSIIELFVKTLPWSAIVLAVILLLVLIIMAIVAIVPGANDDVNSGTSNYSTTDRKTLTKMKKLFNKYPNADGALAIATVLYPYYDVLHSSEVRNYIELGTDEEPEDVYDDTIIDDEDDKDDEDIEKETNEDDSADDDIYLEPFRKAAVRNKLKKVLKKLNNSTEEEFKEYLINDFFKKDKGYFNATNDSDEKLSFNGYKEMFDSVPRDKYDVLAEAIIADLYEVKDLFINYVFEPEVCSSSSTSLGYSDGTDLIKGQAVVVLKDTRATSISSIKSAPTLFGTDDYHMDLKRYVLGVIYAETGHMIYDEDFAKTKMIAAKSFVLGTTYVGGPNSTGRTRTPDYKDNKTIFYLKNNDDDQVFCDVYEGCQNGSRYALSLITPGNGPGSDEYRYDPKPPVSKDKIILLEKWYDETAGEFIYNTGLEQYYSSYRDSSNDRYCPVGACLLQAPAYQDALNGSGYEAILKKYFSNSELVIKNIETNTLSAVSVNCTTVLRGGCTIPDDKFIYYSQRSYNDNFCGRTDATINTSGCGVTSMAMVISNLTDSKVSPVDTMNEAHQGGYCGAKINGTNSPYFAVAASKYGLTHETLAASDTSLDADKKIKDTLSSGGLIIANVAGIETAGTGKPWSTVPRGHYLVIKGITGDEKLIIADPMATDLSNPWKNNLTIEEMRSYMSDKYFYLFTGGNAEKIKDEYCSAKGAGFLGHPINPTDTTSSLMGQGNSNCFPRYCSGSPHGAVDIPLASGTPIYAMDGGTVEVSEYHYSWGNYVLINHENGYKTLYAHFSKLGVKKGQKVNKGDQIGYSGNTGNSTGPHLHIELQNIALYNKYGRSAAKSSTGKGLMNAAKYVNSNMQYVGQSN